MCICSFFASSDMIASMPFESLGKICYFSAWATHLHRLKNGNNEEEASLWSCSKDGQKCFVIAAAAAHLGRAK